MVAMSSNNSCHYCVLGIYSIAIGYVGEFSQRGDLGFIIHLGRLYVTCHSFVQNAATSCRCNGLDVARDICSALCFESNKSQTTPCRYYLLCRYTLSSKLSFYGVQP